MQEGGGSGIDFPFVELLLFLKIIILMEFNALYWAVSFNINSLSWTLINVSYYLILSMYVLAS